MKMGKHSKNSKNSKNSKAVEYGRSIKKKIEYVSLFGTVLLSSVFLIGG